MMRSKIAFSIAALTAAGLLSIYYLTVNDLYRCDDAFVSETTVTPYRDKNIYRAETR
jgi:hypothetical protein